MSLCEKDPNRGRCCQATRGDTDCGNHLGGCGFCTCTRIYIYVYIYVYTYLYNVFIKPQFRLINAVVGDEDSQGTLKEHELGARALVLSSTGMFGMWHGPYTLFLSSTIF